MRITLEKTKHHKHGSEDKIKNHKNLDKRAKKKIEIKKKDQIEKIIYDKLELMIKLKVNKI